MNDVELVHAARRGDGLAFTELFTRNAGQVHDLALAVLRDRSQAAAVVEATFVEATQRLAYLEDEHRLHPWLLAVARRNVALRAAPSAGVDRRPTFDSHDPDRDQLAKLVWDAVADLPVRDRTMIDLAYRQGLHGQDLADAVGLDPALVADLEADLQERIDHGLAGYLVDRSTEGSCPDLTRDVRGWDGRFTSEGASLLARHVASCRACDDSRATLPAPFALYADALPAPFPSSVRPPGIERIVLRVAGGGARGPVRPPAARPDDPQPAGTPVDALFPQADDPEPWLPNGFPPPSFVIEPPHRLVATGDRRRWLAGSAVLGIILLVATVVLVNRDDGETALQAGAATTTTTTFPSIALPSIETNPTFPPALVVDPTTAAPQATPTPTLPAPASVPIIIPAATSAPAAPATTLRPGTVAPITTKRPADAPAPAPTSPSTSTSTTAPAPTPPIIMPLVAGGRFGQPWDPTKATPCDGPWLIRAKVQDANGVQSVTALVSGTENVMGFDPQTGIWSVSRPQENPGITVELVIRARDTLGAEASTSPEVYQCP